MAAISAILFSSDHFDQKEFGKGMLIYGPFTERIVLKNNYFNKGRFMAKGLSLQEPFLNMLRKEAIQVAIYLVNGIKLQGEIESFDQYVIILKSNISQMVYKHAISTIVPSRPMPPMPFDLDWSDA